jgi:hypothetical protein
MKQFLRSCQEFLPTTQSLEQETPGGKKDNK